MTRQYHLKNIRTLLSKGFSPEELRRLCYDIPDFRPVYDELAPSTGKAKIVDQLLEHTERKALLDKLLAWAKENNPAKYKEYQPYYYYKRTNEEESQTISIGGLFDKGIRIGEISFWGCLIRDVSIFLGSLLVLSIATILFKDMDIKRLIFPPPTSSPTITPLATATNTPITTTPTTTAGQTKTPTVTPTSEATGTPQSLGEATATVTTIAVVETPSFPTPLPLDGNLAIPVVFNFGTKVYLTGFDGVGINGPDKVFLGGAPKAEDARQPMFSRDGSSLMVKATIDGVAGLFKLTSSGFNPEIIIRRGSAEWPVLSPDGETVMFSEGTLGYRLHRRLLSPDIDTPEKNIEELSLNGSPIFAKNLLWSEDNRLVFRGCAVWRNAPGECGTWITYANNIDPQRIIVGEAAQPMSIRGGILAYMYRDPGKDWDIFIMSVDGGEAVDITNNDFEDGLPAISPDGNAVAYISNESGAWGVWTVSLDGQNKKHRFDISPGSGVFNTDEWSKDRMSWRR